ncbi:MAG: hypothetical protein PWQ28_391 [Candidatus Woesearchaeota archaeon]|nr:hypothetical protein [Candidatus Woesearchaeota archaeon]
MVEEALISMIDANLFLQMGIIIIAASLFGYLAKKLKQPLIVGYIIAGILLRPLFVNVFRISLDEISILAEIGIAFMLFIVGMELNFKKLSSVRNVAVFGGIISTFLVFLLAFFIALLLGFDIAVSIYLGVIFSFSSTMIILKLLSDNNELDTIHSRIIVGILLIQDVIAIIVTPLLSELGDVALIGIGLNLLKVGLFLGIVYLVSLLIKSPIFKEIASNQELLVIGSVAVSFLFSLIALNMGNIMVWIGNILGINALQEASSGLSIAVGAFMGGVVLANLPYAYEIIGRINPLKDFFGCIFFVSLGLELSFMELGNMIKPMIVMLLFTLLIKPLVNLLVIGAFGYGKKISFQVANPMVQVSEFGLILAMQGLSLGIINRDAYSVVIGSTIIGAIITPYVYNNSNWIYKKISGAFSFLDKRLSKDLESLQNLPENMAPQVMLCGCNRTGYPLLKKAKELSKSVLVVDYNPNVIERLVKEDVVAIYGDATDSEILDRIDFSKLELFISTSPDLDDNLFLLKEVRKRNKKTIVFLTASDVDEALLLYEKGSDYVIIPHFIGGSHTSLLLERFSNDSEGLAENRQKHIQELLERKSLGKHHPMNK